MARLWAVLVGYFWPISGFCATMVVIAAQAAGAPASLRTRLSWLIILAVWQVFYAAQKRNARTWERIAGTWEGTAESWRELYRQASPAGAAIMGDLFPSGGAIPEFPGRTCCGTFAGEAHQGTCKNSAMNTGEFLPDANE
jgi:hypothetical protein